MRVFLCYSRADADLAEAIAIRLRDAGHDVFFDRSKLGPGDGFDEKIRAFLAQTDLLVFLASPASLEANAYAQTELEIYKAHVPQPKNRVLTVLQPGADVRTLPSYLGAVSAFTPRGDVTAHVAHAALAALRTLEQRRLRRRLRLLVPALVVLALSAIAWPLLGGGAVEPNIEFTNPRISLLADASPATAGKFLVRADYTTDRPPGGKETIAVEFDGSDIALRPEDVEILRGQKEGEHRFVAFLEVVDVTKSRQIHTLEGLVGQRWRLSCSAVDGTPITPRVSPWHEVRVEGFTPENVTTLPPSDAAATALQQVLDDPTATILLILGDDEEQREAAGLADALAGGGKPWRKVIWAKDSHQIMDQLRTMWGTRPLPGDLSSIVACSYSADKGKLGEVIKRDARITLLGIARAFAKAEAL